MEKRKEMKSSILIKIVTFWLPVALWAILIFNFSAHPSAQVSEVHWQDFVLKKTIHIVEYAIFTTLIYRALKNSGVEKKEAGYYAIILAILYASSDEFHQSFTPGREPTVRDVIFDTIGGFLSVYALWKLLPKMPMKLKELAKNLQLL